MNWLHGVSHTIKDTQLTCKPTVGVDVLDDCCDLEVYKSREHTFIRDMQSINEMIPSTSQ